MASGYWKRFGKQLINKYGKQCYYCGIELKDYDDIVTVTPLYTNEYGTIVDVNRKSYKNLATVDHIIPRSKGGNNDINNIVPCCFSCNAKKKDR